MMPAFVSAVSREQETEIEEVEDTSQLLKKQR